jgi:predicted enzyme related to lactoylglutathione lyase
MTTHRSRLSTFVIDCPSEDVDSAARFWSQALGRAVVPEENADDRYRTLAARTEEPLLMVQRVSHPGRIHLDIESDDIEAEVQRLERLGARRIEKIRTWWVLEAPTGQRFCVVRPQRGPLGDDASRWDDGAT